MKSELWGEWDDLGKAPSTCFVGSCREPLKLVMADLLAINSSLHRAGFQLGCLPIDLRTHSPSTPKRPSSTVKCVSQTGGWWCSGAGHQVLPVPALSLRAVKLARLSAIASADVGETHKVSAAEDVFVEDTGAAPEADYNWETEWYPLYLLKEVPTDAPLGLTVFDRPLVLFYDGKGVLHCLEDRCPHR